MVEDREISNKTLRVLIPEYDQSKARLLNRCLSIIISIPTESCFKETPGKLTQQLTVELTAIWHKEQGKERKKKLSKLA